MKPRDLGILILLILLMLAIAIVAGNSVADLSPDSLTLNSPKREAAAYTTSPFAFGASMGLLATSLVYCLLVAVILIVTSVKKRQRGVLPGAIAFIAALGFTLSYVIEGYFY